MLYLCVNYHYKKGNSKLNNNLFNYIYMSYTIHKMKCTARGCQICTYFSSCEIEEINEDTKLLEFIDVISSSNIGNNYISDMFILHTIFIKINSELSTQDEASLSNKFMFNLYRILKKYSRDRAKLLNLKLLLDICNNNMKEINVNGIRDQNYVEYCDYVERVSSILNDVKLITSIFHDKFDVSTIYQKAYSIYENKLVIKKFCQNYKLDNDFFNLLFYVSNVNYKYIFNESIRSNHVFD